MLPYSTHLARWAIKWHYYWYSYPPRNPSHHRRLKMEYPKNHWSDLLKLKLRAPNRVVWILIFWPNMNMNIFAITNLQYSYSDIQYSDRNIWISEYIWIFAIYNIWPNTDLFKNTNFGYSYSNILYSETNIQIFAHWHKPKYWNC